MNSMTHFILLIIIPHDIFMKGEAAIKAYIEENMRPYDEQIEMESHIIKTKEELEKEFEEFKSKMKYTDTESFLDSNDYELDKNGNAIGINNQNSIFDYYGIGGNWNGILRGKKIKQSKGKDDMIAKNSIKVEKFLKKYNQDKENNTYYNVIDANRTLHRAKAYGWFGSSIEKIGKDEWQHMYEKILNDSKQDYIINLDCHV